MNKPEVPFSATKSLLDAKFLNSFGSRLDFNKFLFKVVQHSNCKIVHQKFQKNKEKHSKQGGVK